jgi:hypothetical protein
MGMQAVKGGTLGAEMTLQRTQVVFPSKASHSKAIQSDQKRSLLICRRFVPAPRISSSQRLPRPQPTSVQILRQQN